MYIIIDKCAPTTFLFVRDAGKVAMFRSMTAYGRHTSAEGGREITVELRSVNSKYLDISVKIPRVLAPLEARIKSALSAHGISRGRVDVFISYENTDSGNVAFGIDEGYASAYIETLRVFRDKFGLSDDISVMTVAQDRNIFTTHTVEEDPEDVWLAIKPALDAAAEEFVAERCREGTNLMGDLKSKIAGMRELVDKIDALSAGDTQGIKEKIRARIETILADNRVTVDENRLLTECAVWADRIAIDEELVRLRSHLFALEAMMDIDEPVGRKFDFQLQEAGREINTIGSKCQNAEIAGLVVQLKNEAEKIREQIQNIE